MTDRDFCMAIYYLMKHVFLVPNGEYGEPRPVKGTSKEMCYKVLYIIQEMIGSAKLFDTQMTDVAFINWLKKEYNLTDKQ